MKLCKRHWNFWPLWKFLFIVVDNASKYFYRFRYVSNFKSKSIFLNQKHDNLNRYCSDLPKFNGLALDWWAGFSWEFMALCHAFWLKFCNLESKKIKAEFSTSTRLLLPSALLPNIYLIDKSIYLYGCQFFISATIRIPNKEIQADMKRDRYETVKVFFVRAARVELARKWVEVMQFIELLPPYFMTWCHHLSVWTDILASFLYQGGKIQNKNMPTFMFIGLLSAYIHRCTYIHVYEWRACDWVLQQFFNLFIAVSMEKLKLMGSMATMIYLT